VYKGKWKDTMIACKQLKASNDASTLKTFRQESDLMRLIKPHPNLLAYFGICTNPKYPLCIVTEFVPNGNLKLLLKQNLLTKEQKLKIIQGMSKGMHHLAKQKIVHRDLAARNILVSKDYEAKIADFGLSRALTTEENRNTTKEDFGPICWMSPEALQNREYSEKSDVWAFGVTVYEICVGGILYNGLPSIQVATGVTSRAIKLEFPPGIPVVSELVNDCMKYESNDRPTFSQIEESLQKLSVNHQGEWVSK